MQIVKPEAHLMTKEGVTPYQFIERIGRTCYKSTDKITDDSAVKFVKGLASSKHYAMLEHYWVHLMIDCDPQDFKSDVEKVVEDLFNQYGGITDIDKFVQVTAYKYVFLSAPLRVFLELDEKFGELDCMSCHVPTRVDEVMNAVANKFPELIDPEKWSYTNDRVYVMEEDEFCDNIANDMVQFNSDTIIKEQMKHRTHTVLFVCDRGVSHEFVRHRVASFAQESTRYCNYSKDKYGREITVIEPFFFLDGHLDTEHWSERYGAWVHACETAEEMYNRLTDDGATPQEARSVLPNSLKTELIITANEHEWQHIINLRYLGTTGAPHPQIKEVMGLVVKDLVVKSKGRLHA